MGNATGFESARAVAEQHVYRVVAGISDHNVRLAVAVNVRDGHCRWSRSYSDIDVRLEGAVAIANRIEMVFADSLATTRSGYPSPFRSPTATETGPVPVGKSCRGNDPAVTPVEAKPAGTFARFDASTPSETG